MRFALSKIFGMSSSKFQFGRTEKGKPYLINPPNKSSSGCHFNFNVSHQGDYVVLAAEKGSLVGVDVMKVEWPRKFISVTTTFSMGFLNISSIFNSLILYENKPFKLSHFTKSIYISFAFYSILCDLEISNFN